MLTGRAPHEAVSVDSRFCSVAFYYHDDIPFFHFNKIHLGASIPKCVLPFFGSDARHEKFPLISGKVRHGALDKLAALPRSVLRKGHGDVEGVFVTAER